MTENPGRLQVVTGYIPAVDRAPPRRIEAEGWFRVAILMDTYRAGMRDEYLDESLYRATIVAVWRAVAATSAEVDAKEIGRVEAHERLWAAWEARQQEPFREMKMWRNDECVAKLIYEPWWKVGGPELYHDSVTIVVYAKGDLAVPLEAELRRESGEEIQVIRGERNPVREGFFSRLRHLFVP